MSHDIPAAHGDHPLSRSNSCSYPHTVPSDSARSADTLPAMKAALPRLRTTLGSDAAYFAKVYAYTFDFARAEGQRSLATDTAQAFWALLLPHALAGGALARDADGDAAMRAGWQPEYTGWWFEFLAERGGRGVSKDTWTMFLQFVRTIDSKFEEYDLEAAWPSTIDDFVTWAKARVDAQGP
ncbi:DUF298-domain-containing protein [Auriscalpium vulgare]|uniref:DUF298-domain-containing protein n=1 Tax=Auriscalpium vulgare TaxID=40419 RepID=A0ACB8RIJ1_9AGAM|nr:DUF298-domain-containing protein [Auriscalpium vulgare]